MNMHIKKTDRGFKIIERQKDDLTENMGRILQESSAIGDYENSVETPGSSYLWFGNDLSFHLNRDEISKIIRALQDWIDTGRLPDEI